jgi:hypothetical protein
MRALREQAKLTVRVTGKSGGPPSLRRRPESRVLQDTQTLDTGFHRYDDKADWGTRLAGRPIIAKVGKGMRALNKQAKLLTGSFTPLPLYEGEAPRALPVEGATRAGDGSFAFTDFPLFEGVAPRALPVEGATRAPIIALRKVKL